VKKHSDVFEEKVPIWVFEEDVRFYFSSKRSGYRADGIIKFEGRKLTEIINTDHENKKYLPGVSLPENVFAIPDIAETIKDATAIVFVMPHQCESGSLQFAGIMLWLILGVSSR
jgi:glycerol-3-phosphate dehydrogenase (NAD+)